MNKNNVTDLMVALLKATGFDRVRLYVMDPMRTIAIVKCVATADKSRTTALELDKCLKVPFNYKKLFNKDKDYDTNSFLDLVCRFSEHDTFDAELNKLSNIPNDLRAYQKANKINHIAMSQLLDSPDEYIGHVVVDKSLSDDPSITESDVRKLDEFVKLMMSSIIDSVHGDDHDQKRNRLINVVNALLEMIQKKKSPDDQIKFLISSIFEICEAIEIIQIKEILPKAERYKYLYIWINPTSSVDIPENKKELILSLQGKEFPIDKMQRISLEVYKEQKTLHIKNIKKASQFFRDEYTERKEKYGDRDARCIIAERNLSEVNVPLTFGSEAIGIIDAHGRRPYTIDDNTVEILKNIAPWISSILKFKEIGFTLNIQELKLQLNMLSAIVTRGSIDEHSVHVPQLREPFKGGVITSHMSMNDLNAYIWKSFIQQIPLQHDEDVKAFMWYRQVKIASTAMLALCVISMPPLILSGQIVIHPILSISGLIGAPFFIWMSKKAEKEYSDTFNKRKEMLKSTSLERISAPPQLKDSSHQ